MSAFMRLSRVPMMMPSSSDGPDHSKRIIAQYMSNALQAMNPQIDADEHWYRFILQRIGSGKVEKGAPYTTQETTQERILLLIRKNPGITRKAIAIEVGVTEDGIKYHLDKMRKSGVLRHVGPTKGGHWEILK